MKKRILHAEDEQLVRAYIDEALHFLGHEVVGVTDGEAALSRLEKQTFDIVITDHHMPHTGGLELVRTLRDRDFGGHIYVLASALNASDRREYEALGVDGIAAKPISLMELNLLLKDTFSEASSRRSRAVALQTSPAGRI